MKIVTGVGEGPHVTSKEMRRIIECMSGQGSYIIDCGEQLKPELVSNNLLKIRSGSMVHHGNVSSVDPYDEIEVMNGTQGMKRIDLIVNRYAKNAETQIETNKWIVIQGTPVASNPTVPKHTVGKLQDGDLVDDCPYIQITLDGINVTEVKQLLKVMPNIPDLVAESTNESKKITELKNDVNNIYIGDILAVEHIYNSDECLKKIKERYEKLEARTAFSGILRAKSKTSNTALNWRIDGMKSSSEFGFIKLSTYTASGGVAEHDLIAYDGNWEWRN